ncbi:MAG: YraN family protein [Candidatus Saganbacteria bacterium]|nr:YraN family protein [Candidatus Saganbacteria bacterium]
MGRESYDIGKAGEDFAATFLEGEGYRIVERNFRSAHGEIDIIAFDREVLVFVEVKNYSYRSFGPPTASIRREKKASLVQAAKTYLFLKKIKDVFCRFDVLAIYRSEPGEKTIDLYKDAFQLKGGEAC